MIGEGEQIILADSPPRHRVGLHGRYLNPPPAGLLDSHGSCSCPNKCIGRLLRITARREENNIHYPPSPHPCFEGQATCSIRRSTVQSWICSSPSLTNTCRPKTTG